MNRLHAGLTSYPLVDFSIFENTLNNIIGSFEKVQSEYSFNYYVEVENGNHVIEYALAGFTKSEIKVTVTNQDLTVEVNPDKSKEVESTFLRHGIAKRSMHATWRFGSSSFNLKDIKITFRDGLLKIVVPPSEAAKAKEIEISN